MAIKMVAGIKYEGKEPNFARDQFNTLKEMFSFSAMKLPQIFHAMNLEDGCMWIYNKSNTSDPVTGKWRKFEAGGGGGSANIWTGTEEEFTQDVQDSLPEGTLCFVSEATST